MMRLLPNTAFLLQGQPDIGTIEIGVIVQHPGYGNGLWFVGPSVHQSRLMVLIPMPTNTPTVSYVFLVVSDVNDEGNEHIDNIAMRGRKAKVPNAFFAGRMRYSGQTLSRTSTEK
jgi:hypothetical protein